MSNQQKLSFNLIMDSWTKDLKPCNISTKPLSKVHCYLPPCWRFACIWKLHFQSSKINLLWRFGHPSLTPRTPFRSLMGSGGSLLSPHCFRGLISCVGQPYSRFGLSHRDCVSTQKRKLSSRGCHLCNDIAFYQKWRFYSGVWNVNWF